MGIFYKRPTWSIILSLLGAVFLVGWWLHAVFFLPLALASFGGAFAFMKYPKSRSSVWAMIPVLFLFFAILTGQSPTYSQQRLISRDVEDCVVAKGSLSSCLKEAKTLRGYDVRSFISYVDWHRAMKGCLAQSSARSCVEDFVKNGEADEAGMSSVEVASVCLGAADRTDCLLTLAQEGFPFREIGVVDDVAP